MDATDNFSGADRGGEEDEVAVGEATIVEDGGGGGGKDEGQSLALAAISEEIDRFLDSIPRPQEDGQNEGKDAPAPAVPEAAADALLSLVEEEMIDRDAGQLDRPAPAPLSLQPDRREEFSFLDAIDRISKLMAALGGLGQSEADGRGALIDRAGIVLRRAMAFLEEDFRLLLEGCRVSGHENHCSPGTPGKEASIGGDGEECSATAYPPEIVERMRRIAGSMLSSGYETECCQVFVVARRNAFEEGLSRLGVERISIGDVQRMPWEALEGEVATWIKAFRHSAARSFSRERDICFSVFSGASRPDVGAALLSNLVGGVVIHLLNFAEAVAVTKPSAEKLFRFLDMYETLRDLIPQLDALFLPPNHSDADNDSGGCSFPLPPLAELKTEVRSAGRRLAGAAVAIFSDLEASISSDAGKTPVPGGAVHPLTRYILNYLKYACEYKNTLEEVFEEHHRTELATCSSQDEGDVNNGDTPDQTVRSDGASSGSSHDGRQYRRGDDDGGGQNKLTPFAARLVRLMELLSANLESKSKLYKDPALSSIFLMNNGRYIMQKIKGSPEIHSLLGDDWRRKRSSDLRQYHKNYQRETWGKVLGCFKDEGLQAKGNVSKPMLKERFKCFNAMMEEIHRTQSCWVVSDEQLQSELRVSISAVVVPAYRSFLGRFQQHLDAGRHSERYIKFGSDDLEAYIDDLFGGIPAPSVKRRAQGR